MKIYLGIPAYHQVATSFAGALIRLIKNPPGPMQVEILEGVPYVGRARNILAADFLKSDCTHLLFIDNDLIFERQDVEYLMEREKQIVGGFYAKKQPGRVVWVCNALPDGKSVADPSGLMPLKYLGTGFMLIERQVFEVMMDDYPELAFKDDEFGIVMHDFFSIGVHPGPPRRWLSEDWWFCQRALDSSFEVWGDTRCKLQHIGRAVYPIAGSAPDRRIVV